MNKHKKMKVVIDIWESCYPPLHSYEDGDDFGDNAPAKNQHYFYLDDTCIVAWNHDADLIRAIPENKAMIKDGACTLLPVTWANGTFEDFVHTLQSRSPEFLAKYASLRDSLLPPSPEDVWNPEWLRQRAAAIDAGMSLEE